MNKTQYNACMRSYIKGKKDKEQRSLDFCIGAKVCSGKAPNAEEAKKLCLRKKEDCSMRMKRTSDNIDSVIKQISEGKNENIEKTLDSMLIDIKECHSNSKVTKVARESFKEMKQILQGGNGDLRQVVLSFNAIKGLIT